jgi:hypothetical protein
VHVAAYKTLWIPVAGSPEPDDPHAGGGAGSVGSPGPRARSPAGTDSEELVDVSDRLRH